MNGDFFRGAVKERTVGGFRICRADYPRQLFMPRHYHGDAYFSFILSGGFQEKIGRLERHTEPMQLLFHPPDETHEVKFAPVRTQILRVEIPACLDHRFEHLGIDRNVAAGPVGGSAVAVARRLAGEFQNTDAASDLILEGLCLELLAGLARHPIKEAPVAKRAEEYMRACLFQPICFDRMAEEFNVSPSCLSRSFRKENGVSLGAYSRQLRLDWAAGQLATTSRSVGEIAADAGFWDQAHFCRAFRNAWGSSPGQYRKSLSKR